MVNRVTDTIRDAVADAVGYDMDDDAIAYHVRQCQKMDTEDMEEELADLVENFTRRGGRGVELADRIDTLRVALAVRSCDATST